MIQEKDLRKGINVYLNDRIIEYTSEYLSEINNLEGIILTMENIYELGFVDFSIEGRIKSENWFLIEIGFTNYIVTINEWTQEEYDKIVGIKKSLGMESNSGYIHHDIDGMYRNKNGHCTIGIYSPKETIPNVDEDGLEKTVTINMSMVNFSWKIRYVHDLQNIIYSLTKKEINLKYSLLSDSLGYTIEEYKSRYFV